MTTTATAPNAWANVNWNDVPTPDSNLASVGLAFESTAALNARLASRGSGDPTASALASAYGEAARLILAQKCSRAQVAAAALEHINHADTSVAALGGWHQILDRLATEPNRVARARLLGNR